MKRRHTASVVGTGRRYDAIVPPLDAQPTQQRIIRNRPRPPEVARAHLRLAGARAWAHTIRLTGDLHQRSAHLLEAEIDRLCEEGVDEIMLDLRGLASIDRIGVAVIVFRCKLCPRRGCRLSLIRGDDSIDEVFRRAGVAELLPFCEEEVRIKRVRAEDRAEELAPERTG